MSTRPTVDAQPERACRFDPDAIRTWLAAANPNGSGTVAEALRIVDDFDIYGFDRWVRISDLLAAAQTAGVFGLDHDSIGVLHLAGERGFVNAHRFTLTTAGYGVLCSSELDTLDLLTDHLSGVDAAVHLLAGAAHTADTLLHQRTQLARLGQAARTANVDATTPADTRSSRHPGAARGFRPLAINPQLPAPPVPTPDTTTTPKRRHH